MKLRNTLLAATIAALPSLALAQPVTGPYVSLGGGVNFLQNELNRPANAGPQSSNLAYRFDTGWSGEASVGYGFGNGVRLELEGDYANNHVRGVSSVTPYRAGGNQQEYGGFINGFYDIDLGLPVTPYLGAGFGYQEVELDGLNYGGPGITVPTRTRQNGDFAYQGIAGVSYSLDSLLPGLAATLEYRFIGVVPLDYNQYNYGSAVNGVLPTSSRVTFDDIFNHQILIGLRYAFYTPPPPPPPAAPVPIPTAEAARTYLVFFDWDKATLTDRARQIISEAAQASTRVQTTRIEVNGYTDTSGTPKYNQGLSVRRAQAVEGELVKDGVPKAEISIHGYGETKLLVQTGPGVREPQNRRVEIILR